jgi:hypothetical protein
LKYLSLTFIAIREADIITVEEIINKPDLEFNEKNEDGETPLYLGLINLNFKSLISEEISRILL